MMMMTSRHLIIHVIFLTAFLAILLTTAPRIAQAQSAKLTEQNAGQKIRAVTDYMNRVKKFKSTFQQINPDGSLSKGVLYMNRPGKMRLDYQEPQKISLFAASNAFTFVDYDNAHVESYPFSLSPATVLLDNKINFYHKSITFINLHQSKAGDLFFTLSPKKNDPQADAGKIILRFGEDPITLKGWQITDAADNVVEVELAEINQNVSYPYGFFIYEDDAPKGR